MIGASAELWNSVEKTSVTLRYSSHATKCRTKDFPDVACAVEWVFCQMEIDNETGFKLIDIHYGDNKKPITWEELLNLPRSW